MSLIISSRDNNFLFITEYNKISARVRIQLKQFENEMSQLDKKLMLLAKNRSITEQERERRMRQLEVLASKKVQLDSRFQNTPGSSTRNQLFAAAGRNTKLFDDDESDEPMLDSNATLETLRSEQTQIIQEQDKGLENLSQVIARQKKLAMKIGNEIEDQNDIIDNIAVQMDHTSDRVNSETRHVETVSSKDSTWSYWIVIISLFVAIIVVGIL